MDTARVFLVFPALALLTLTSPAGGESLYARESLYAGMALEKAGEFGKALDCYRAVAKADRTLAPAEVSFHVGVCQAGLGRWDRAILPLETALAATVVHGDPMPYELLAHAYLREGRPRDAKSAAERGLRMYPGSPWLHQFLSDAILQTGRQTAVSPDSADPPDPPAAQPAMDQVGMQQGWDVGAQVGQSPGMATGQPVGVNPDGMAGQQSGQQPGQTWGQSPGQSQGQDVGQMPGQGTPMPAVEPSAPEQPAAAAAPAAGGPAVSVPAGAGTAAPAQPTAQPAGPTQPAVQPGPAAAASTMPSAPVSATPASGGY